MNLYEKNIEYKLNKLNLNAPRLTPANIDSKITGHTFTMLPSGKVMVCEIILENGFSVRGESATVSKENFNEAIGKEISYKEARDKIWLLEGYLLQEQISSK